ncbi:hypothetical protein MTO96_013206 [Rhipicephalus appendiculatus]
MDDRGGSRCATGLARGSEERQQLPQLPRRAVAATAPARFRSRSERLRALETFFLLFCSHKEEGEESTMTR